MYYHLIYHSRAIDEIARQDIYDILHTARTFNPQHQITGCLVYYHQEFLQLLEGEKATVLDLYDRIIVDKRHQFVNTILEDKYPTRYCPEWSMAYLGEESLVGMLNEEEFEKIHAPHLNAPLIHKLFHVMVSNIKHRKN